MHVNRTIAYHSPHGRAPSRTVVALARERGLELAEFRTLQELDHCVNQSLPACVVVGDGEQGDSLQVCRAMKRDPFTAIIPVIFLVRAGEDDLLVDALEAGADEVLTDRMEERERLLRLRTTLDRADRDVSVHPTTRLPGTVQIERDMAERIRRGDLFAVCYADLDHFKEFNDRYGYNEGDRVILLLSRILRDVVKGYTSNGFVGHIGGDDFIFSVPFEKMRLCCEEILDIFDELIPYQYTEDDRRAGYFLGKDRRGNVLRIPLMTLSIGVVTNQHRVFTHTARISELATEMKAYAKTLSGSVYAVDRRRDARRLVAAGAQPNTLTDAPELVAES
jgi:GGDEF domain-containing protein